jgi:hypothetical protein
MFGSPTSIVDFTLLGAPILTVLLILRDEHRNPVSGLLTRASDKRIPFFVANCGAPATHYNPFRFQPSITLSELVEINGAEAKCGIRKRGTRRLPKRSFC